LKFTARALVARAPASQKFVEPRRPVVGGAMSEAQRVDLMAAQAGKISWAAYFAMWGPGG